MDRLKDDIQGKNDLTTMGLTDPSMITQDEFSQSRELLFHGTNQDFLYDQSLLCPGNNLNGYLMGEGFYCTDSRKEATERYAKKGVTKEFLPFNAHMLDLRECNNYLPKYVIETYFLASKKLPPGFFSRKGIMGKWWQQRRWLSFLEFLYVNHNHPINLKELLKTGDCSYFHYQKYGSNILKRYNAIGGDSLSPGSEMDILGDVLRVLRIDGIICYERGHILEEFRGAEDDVEPDSSYYIFYNPSVIGTFENWKNKKKTQERVVDIINPPLS